MAKHKYKGGQSGKQSYLSSIAQAGSRPMGEYTKYGDYNPKDVHEGDATYRGRTQSDAPSTVRSAFSQNVKRGHGKTVFRFQEKLYQITNFSGSISKEIQI
jgi:hypothetical protein